MCTASLIALEPAGWRLVFTRDELRSRAPAAPPQRREVEGVACAWPTDGQAGGTWLAASARGLALALLNRNDQASAGWQAAAAARSRGLLIPELIGAADAAAVAARLAALALQQHAPFVLLAIDDHQALSLSWDGRRLEHAAAAHGSPLLWSSSGRGDALVAAPRRAAFAAVLAAPGPEAQDAFHASRLGGEPAAWVAMRREDARSVSCSALAVTPQAVELRYAALDEDGGEQAPQLLRLQRVG